MVPLVRKCGEPCRRVRRLEACLALAAVALEEPQGDRAREDVSAEQEVSADQEESANQKESTLEDPRKGGGQSEQQPYALRRPV